MSVKPKAENNWEAEFMKKDNGTPSIDKSQSESNGTEAELNGKM
jgi:hypothetical protein